jgi:hypothetical protein
MELRSSGENAADKDVDHLYLWCFARDRDVDEEFGNRRQFDLAVEVDEDNVVIVPEEAVTEDLAHVQEGEDLTLPMDLNMGRPDYQPTWIVGADAKQKSRAHCSATQPCNCDVVPVKRESNMTSGI